MQRSQIKVGGYYVAKVGGKLVTVRVDAIRNGSHYLSGKAGPRTSHMPLYDVTNLATGRKTTFRSAAKFRSPAPEQTKVGRNPSGTIVVGKPDEVLPLKQEAEHSPDPQTESGDAATTQAAHIATGTESTRQVNCPRCSQPVEVEGGRYVYHKKPSNITCGMSGESAIPHQVRGQEDKVAKIESKMRTDSLGRLFNSSLKEKAEPKPEGEQRRSPTTSGSGSEGSQANEGEHSADPTTATPAINAERDTQLASISSVQSAEVTTPVRTSLAGKIASTRTAYQPGTQVAGYTPTEEQAAILEVASQPGLTVLVIGAGAGAGKTSTLKMLESILPGRGQYTAFNTSLVAESKAKFQKAKCNTTHSLAFGSVGRQYAHRLGGNRVRSDQVAAMLGIGSMTVTVPDPSGKLDENDKPVVLSKVLQPGFLASQIMQAIRKFCQSADREITKQHFKQIAGIDKPGEYTNQNETIQFLLPFARKAWEDLCNPNGSLPFNHDCYVKIWQLGEGQQTPVIPADYILLDEAQDTAPVFLDVLQRQSALIILVGDDNQQIYEWRGAVNAMASFPGAPRKLLSQSFRFGQAVADVANSILATLDEPTDLVMRGCDIPSRVILPNEFGEPSGESCQAVLCRTNACAVGTVLAAVREKKRPYLIGGGAETVKFVKAAQDLQQGRGTSHPELCLFKNWAEVQAYVKEDEGSDLKLMVKLIDEFKCGPILAALEHMPREEDADLVVSTAHKSKGREWTSVKLAGDFPPANRMCDADRRLLYVAATRAQHVLDLSECTPFLVGKDRVTGEEIRPIQIQFTKPIPTEQDYLLWLNTRGQPKPEVVEVPNRPTVQTEPTQSNSKPEFTWANFGGGWKVGGPRGYEHKTVEVTRKNGSTSTEQLGKVAKDLGDRCIYNLA